MQSSEKSSKIKTVHNSKSEGDTKILFPSSEKKLVERHQEKRQRRQDGEHETDDKSQKKNVTGLTIAPTSEDTFEVIDELGNHLENIYDGCSPTFATNGEKSMNWNQPAASCLQQNNSRSGVPHPPSGSCILHLNPRPFIARSEVKVPFRGGATHQGTH